MRTSLASLSLLAAPTVLAAGVAVGLLLNPADVPADLSPPEPVTSVPVVRQAFDDARQPSLRFTIDPNVRVTTTRTGRVTESLCQVGVPLASGQPVVRVDDRPVVALATRVPLYRDLASGAKGADVRALQEELARLGHDVRVTGTYDRRTVAAVKVLQKQVGASRSGALALADVAWLPTASVTPTACTAGLGATLADGELATVAGALRRVSFDRPGALAPGDRTLTALGQSVTLPGDADGSDDADFLARVAATREFATVRKDPEADVTGEYRLATPVDAWKVPPAALFGLTQGSACLQVDEEAVPVTILGSGLGASLVGLERELTDVRVGAGITHDDCPVTS